MAQFDRIPMGAGLGMALNPTLLVASLALNLFGVALPIFTLQIYDRVIPNAASDTLALLVLLLATILVGEGILRGARNMLTSWAGARFEHAVGCAAIGRLLNAEYVAVSRDSAGTQLERLGAVDRLREFYANQGATIFVDLPFALIFAGLIWVIGGSLVWVVAAVFAAFAVAALGVAGFLRSAIAARAQSDDRRISFMIEVLTGVTTVKALTMERQMMRRYERLMDQAAAGAHRVTNLSSLSQTLGMLFSNLAVVAVLGYGALQVIDGDLTVGQLACCSLLAGRTLQPLMRAMGIWTNYQSIRNARARLQALAEMPQEPVAGEARAVRVAAGAIELRGVDFGYGPGRTILKDADLSIKAGECVAIVGTNGTGRSTVLSLLAGLVRPQAGTIAYDGAVLKADDARPGPAEIGILPRHGVVFQGRLIDNLTMFRRGPIVDAALDVSARLGLDAFVAAQPQGYETELGDPEALPGGVRQRIAIVRALADAPRIVLFDESNNSLDHDSNDRLLQMLRELKGRSTLVLVSYQPSVLRIADRVLELRDGRFHERPRGSA
ncbi:MAG: peptidase domain-containing ABC transporter [Rhodospirillales bacterium]|jgi:ATP-binding cassette subfamily C protein LapB